MVATLALAKGDFVFATMLVLKVRMLDFEHLWDAIHKQALGLPGSCPRAWLQRPLRMLGLHAPRLGHRHAMQYIRYIMCAISSRSSYISTLLRAELHGNEWAGQPHPDARTLRAWLEARGLDLWILPRLARSDTHVQVRVYQWLVSGAVVIASHGATWAQAIAYAAVLADKEGIFA